MLQSDWLDCKAFWRRRENYPPKGHCLKIFVIFRKRKKPVYSICHWLLCWIFDRHPGSEQMELTTLLEAKRDAGKLFRSSWVPLGENKRERVHHGHPPTLDCHGCIHVELNWVSYSSNLNETTIKSFLQVMNLTVQVWVQAEEDSVPGYSPTIYSSLLGFYSLFRLTMSLSLLLLYSWTPTRHLRQHSSPKPWKEHLKTM